MSPSTVEALARAADLLERDILAMRPLSRTNPHIFIEQKDDLRRRARTLAVDIRQQLSIRPGADLARAKAVFPNIVQSSEMTKR